MLSSFKYSFGLMFVYIRAVCNGYIRKSNLLVLDRLANMTHSMNQRQECFYLLFSYLDIITKYTYARNICNSAYKT